MTNQEPKAWDKRGASSMALGDRRVGRVAAWRLCSQEAPARASVDSQKPLSSLGLVRTGFDRSPERHGTPCYAVDCAETGRHHANTIQESVQGAGFCVAPQVFQDWILRMTQGGAAGRQALKSRSSWRFACSSLGLTESRTAGPIEGRRSAS